MNIATGYTSACPSIICLLLTILKTIPEQINSLTVSVPKFTKEANDFSLYAEDAHKRRWFHHTQCLYV